MTTYLVDDAHDGTIIGEFLNYDDAMGELVRISSEDPIAAENISVLRVDWEEV